MRTLMMALALALLLAGCGDPHQAQREAVRNEAIAFRVATSNVGRGMILISFQKLETAIAVARADGVKFDEDTEACIDRMLNFAEQARMAPSSDAALNLAAEASILEIYVTEEH